MALDLNRREFLYTSTKAALLAWASVYIVGCEDEKYTVTEDADGNLVVRDVVDPTVEAGTEDGEELTSKCPPGSCEQKLDGGHTHPCSIQSDTAIKLDCFGGHIHTVSLSDTDLSDLCVTGSITKESSVDFGHTHRVIISV